VFAAHCKLTDYYNSIFCCLRSVSKLPIVLKGILTAEDARLAVQHGVDGIIVSCHGGRELDTVPASVSKVVGIHVVNSIGNIGLSQMQVRRNVVVIIVVVSPRSSMLYCSSPTLLECHIPYSGATIKMEDPRLPYLLYKTLACSSGGTGMRVERAKPLIKLNILRCLKCKLIIYIYIECS
jgi:hypothetical protein